MQFIIKILIITLLGYLCSMFMPWWTLIIMTALVTFVIPGNNFNAFLSGFLAIGLLWLIMAWKTDIETESVISSKVVVLFGKEDVNILILATGLVGALAGGLGAFTGNSFRQLFLKKKEKSFYS